MSDTTKDTIIWPDLVIHQPKHGYRFSMDSVVLARLVKSNPADTLLEIGSGCAVCLLILSKASSIKKLTGVEIQKNLYELSLKNIGENDLCKRINLINEDIKQFSKACKDKFDIIISNPPFYPDKSGRLNKSAGEVTARHEIALDIASLLKSVNNLLRPKGCFYLIYNSQRTAELMSEMRNFEIEPKLILPIYSNLNEASNLIWVKGIKNAKKGLKLLKPLFFYSSKNKQSKELKAFYVKSSKTLEKIYPEIFSGK